jgi:hypothetical protein
MHIFPAFPVSEKEANPGDNSSVFVPANTLYAGNNNTGRSAGMHSSPPEAIAGTYRDYSLRRAISP